MPTFRAVILRHHIRDNCAKIKILVTHHSVRRYIDTGISCSLDDVTRRLKIKSPSVIDACNEIISLYRQKVNNNILKVQDMSADDLVTYLISDADIDFLAYSQSHIDNLIACGRVGAARNRTTAINALKTFSGNVYFKDITVKFLTDFERNLKANSRSVSLYLGEIRTIYNEIKRLHEFSYSPFDKYKIPSQPVAKHRALSVETLRDIFSVKAEHSRERLALDCVKLSFCLIGMNSVDLYTCSIYKDGYITYYRAKTTSRRSDMAEFKVKVQPQIEGLVQMYLDLSGVRVFNFYQRYSDFRSFNKAINIGLKSIMKGLTFYNFRHSWATIAVNLVGIDKWTVHAALNHVDGAMRITDGYIQKDFEFIDLANKKVLDYVIQGPACEH